MGIGRKLAEKPREVAGGRRKARRREAGRRDDVIIDPPTIWLTGHLLDDFAQQRETVIGVFERNARRERLWRREIGAKLRFTEEGRRSEN